LHEDSICPLPPRALPRDRRWQALLHLAASQAGYFTLAQTRSLGFQRSLLSHHARRGRLQRVRRGLYRLPALPAHRFEALVPIWLWSGGSGTFSHGTALHLHGLLDVAPRFVQLSVPPGFAGEVGPRPGRVALHRAEVSLEERELVHGLPVTTVPRALREAASSLRDRRWLEAALRRALALDLVALPTAHELLARFRA
jgi:predicted transcriptional regulator of viral defense system